MISKAKQKELSSYKMQKVCDMDGVFVVEGPKMCGEALREKMPVKVIVATHEWLVDAQCLLGFDLDSLSKSVLDSGAMLLGDLTLFEANDSELERVSGMKTPNQVWMLVKRPTVKEVEWESIDKVLVLDHLQDPGNLGTIIRTADWFGIRHIVCSNDSVSCFNPKVIQSSMGGVFRTHVHYTPLVPFMSQMRDRGYAIYGAVLNGANVFETEMRGKSLLVVGNESKGISPEVVSLITDAVSIPNIGGTCESLNAAVATAILCAEWLR